MAMPLSSVASIASTRKNVFYALQWLASEFVKLPAPYSIGDMTYASLANATRFTSVNDALTRLQEYNRTNPLRAWNSGLSLVRVIETTTTIPGKDTRTVISENEARTNVRGVTKWSICGKVHDASATYFVYDNAYFGARSLDGAILFDNVADAATLIATKGPGGLSPRTIRIVPVRVETTTATTDIQTEVIVLA